MKTNNNISENNIININSNSSENNISFIKYSRY